MELFVLVRASRVQRNALCWTQGCCAAHTHYHTTSHTLMHAFKLTLKYQQQRQRSVEYFMMVSVGMQVIIAFSSMKEV